MSSDAALLVADTQARSDALDTSRSFIVQAPAGSGKTELLIQRYLKLLSEVASPEEVLAITFTRKAALEMQLRVVAALRAAGSGEVPLEPHRKLTAELAQNALARDFQCGWQLVNSPRRMRIQTLDAFNAAIARSLPISSGLGGAGKTDTDEQIRTLYREAASATLDWLTTSDPMSRIVEQVLVHLDNNSGLYVSYISRMLQTRDQWLLFVGSGSAMDFEDPDGEASSRLTREAGIKRLVSAYLQKARESFPPELAGELQLLANYAANFFRNEGREHHPLNEIDDSGDLPGTTSANLEAWRAIAQMLLTQKGDFRKTVTKANGFPPDKTGHKEKMLELLRDLASAERTRHCLRHVQILPAPNYSNQQWETLGALIRLLPYAVIELQQRFSDIGVTDHIEVARAASAALGSADEPGDMALLLDHTVRHLLIDEMQDTSIGQYQLLETLTGGWQDGDGRTLFCVGDPMQSIYRFRDAEVSRFVLARRNGVGALKPGSLLLRRNFRSGENLVHWFNTVFDQIMPTEDDPMTGAVSYTDSVPVEGHRGSGDCQVHALFGVSAMEEAEHGSRIVQECLRKFPAEDTVVLVRSRSQLPYLLASLRHAGILYQAIEIDRLTDLPEITDLLALTRALCHDGDRLAWLALLRGPWVGLTWQDLHALVVNDGHSTVQELLQSEQRTEGLSEEGRCRIAAFQSLLGPFLQPGASESLRERLECAWFALGGPELLRDGDQLDNVYRYFDVVEKIEVGGTIADISELETLLDDERVSSHANGECCLQIMTMHKAKGLQFDHVILYGLGRRTSGGSKSVLSWLNLFDDAGNDDMIISPVGPRFELDNDPLHQFIEAIEKEKDRAELDRLLYVACTRAIKTLHLVGSVPLTADSSDFRAPHAGSLLRRLWPAVQHQFAGAFDDSLHDDKVPLPETATLVSPRLKRLLRNESAMVPPEVPASTIQRQAPADNENRPVDYYWVGATARHAGTVVHRLLQKHTDGEIQLKPGSARQYRVEVERQARQLGVGDSQIVGVRDRVEQAIESMLQDTRGHWLLDGDGHAELSLTGLWKSRVESIVIDRIRIEDGVHWIVDYKTSTHEGGNLPQFLQQESDRYRTQLQKYATIYGGLFRDVPVRTALYFPLMQEFCEVPLGDQDVTDGSK